MITVRFELEKETPGTFKFKELLPSEMANPKIGSLYVKKGTLGELGYERGELLQVHVETVSVEQVEKMVEAAINDG